MTTVAAIIHLALKDAGVTGEGQNASAESFADAFATLGQMVALWQADGLMVYAHKVQSLSLTGAASYSVGAGGTWAIARPAALDSAQYRSGGIDHPVTLCATMIDFERLGSASGAIPYAVRYEPTFPLGTLYVAPTGALGELRLVTRVDLPTYPDHAADINVPPEYASALRYNLAEMLTASFQTPLRPDLMELAKRTRRLLKRNNVSVPLARFASSTTFAASDYAAVAWSAPAAPAIAAVDLSGYVSATALSSQNGASLTGYGARTVAAKLADSASVSDYGVAGDPAAIAAAIAANPGRVIEVPFVGDDTALPADYSGAALEYTGTRAMRATHLSTIIGMAKKLFKAQFSAGHADSQRAALHIETQAQGSGKNGPDSADYALSLAIHKKGYAGGTNPPAGEIDGLTVTVRQDGPKGTASGAAGSSDATGVLVNIQNVEDVGFTSAWEASSSNYNRTSGTIVRLIQTQVGVLDMNQTNAPSYGYVAIASVGANDHAFYAGSTAGTWKNIVYAPNAVRIDASGNYYAPTTDWPALAWSIVRAAGPNGSTQITHRGTGALFLFAQDAGAIQFGTNNAIRWEVNSSGTLRPSSTNTVGSLGDQSRRISPFVQSIDMGSTSTNGIQILPGDGSPEGIVTAPKGSLYLRRDGGANTTLYIKESGIGNTGWSAK